MRKDKVVSDVLGEELAISPSDLCNHELRRAAVGGYDRAEVDELLERVADVMESLIAKIAGLQKDNEALQHRIEEFRQVEATLHAALASSQRFGEEVLDNARREAAAIVEEAKVKRAEILLDAKKIPEVVASEIRMLEDQRRRLRIELIAILDTHRNLLDSLVPGNRDALPAGLFEFAGSEKPAPPAEPMRIGDPATSRGHAGSEGETAAEGHAAFPHSDRANPAIEDDAS